MAIADQLKPRVDGARRRARRTVTSFRRGVPGGIYFVKGERPPARAEGALAPDESLPRACIIGAGSAGIAVAKQLYEARVPFDCFEMGTDIGGIWTFKNSNGRSAAYQTLEMNTSGPCMAFSDFPVREHYPDYPMHWQVAEYFNEYVDHFGFRETITFETTVEHVEPAADGGFDVTITGAGASGAEETRHYDAVLVANGHHWDPRWLEPAFPGSFEGEQMHSHSYRDGEVLRGKRVVIVGGGNSGMDIAVAASYHAKATYLSLRRPYWILPKFLRGKPIDQQAGPPTLPLTFTFPILERLIRREIGTMGDYGLPEPDYGIANGHPTVSREIHDRLEAGAIEPRPNIAELRGERVAFEDGSEAEADLIVYCTGYKVRFPFFDEDVVSAPGNDLRLFRRTFHPEIGNLYFIGFMQPAGALMPIDEQQGKWIAAHLRGEYRLPSRTEIDRDIEAERAAHAKRFYSSPRHTFEVDRDRWLMEAIEEIERGALAAQPT